MSFEEEETKGFGQRSDGKSASYKNGINSQMLSYKQSKFYYIPPQKQTHDALSHLPMSSTEEQAFPLQPQSLNLQKPSTSPKQEPSSSSPEEPSECTSLYLTGEQFKKLSSSDELQMNLLNISQINQEETQVAPVFNQPPEDNSEKGTLPVLKRRRLPNKPFYRDRHEQNDTSFYNNRRNSQFQRPKSHKKSFREEERYHHKSYQQEEYNNRTRDREEPRYCHNTHKNYQDSRHNYEQRNYYQETMKNYPDIYYQENNHLTPQSPHYRIQSPQYYKPNQHYYQGGATQAWNGSTWINYVPVSYAQTSTPLMYHNYGICQPHQYQEYLIPLNAYPLQPPPQHYYVNPEPTLPTKDSSPSKQKTTSILPSPFADICLPKFQITVKNCCISVNYCSTSRLQADLMVLLHSSQSFDCFPSYTIEDHFTSKEEGEKTIKEALKGHKENGAISFVKAQKSQFKVLAFMKVCSPYSNTFTGIFNRGLVNLFTMGAPTVRSVVLPYNDKYGSSREKAKQLIELMKAGPNGFEQIIVNCSDLPSFKRMVDGFNTVVSKMEAQITV